MQSVIFGIVRALLAAYAGVIGTTDADLSKGLHDFIDGLMAGNSNQIASAGLTLVVIIWSVYSKKKDAKEKAK